MDIVIIILLILLNFFFALVEAAFISSRKAKIIEAGNKGRKSANLVLISMEEPEKFLSTIQVGITLIAIISGTFGGLTIAKDLQKVFQGIPFLSFLSEELSLIIVVGSITYASIVAGELFPKSIALRKPEQIILLFIPVMNIFTHLFYPVVIFLTVSTRLLLKVFRIRDSGRNKDNPVKEIVSLTRLAIMNKRISKDQQKILLNTINISKIKLQDIMVKKEDMVLLNADMNLMDALIESHIHHHTRYPIYEGSPDRITGYINLKDIYSALQINPEFNNLKSISRDMITFQENEKIIDVLPVLQKNFQHIALVVDSFGNTAGLITLEDVIESLIGDINDEHDLLPENICRILENRYIVGGGIRLGKLKNSLNLNLPDSSMILSDWIKTVSNAPVVQELKINYDNCEFTVRKIKKGKIAELILQIQR